MTLRTTELAGEALLDGARDSSRPPYELASTDNLDVLLAVLPPRISDAVADAGRRGGYDNLVEIVMDLGRIPGGQVSKRRSAADKSRNRS